MRDKRLKTLILSVVFSGFGPVVTGIALFMNTSATQFADFLRRSVELGVLILALVLYVKLTKQAPGEQKKQGPAALMYRVSGLVLLISALVLLLLFINALLQPAIPEGNVLPGLAVAMLGVFFNGYFWMRYRLFNHEETSVIMDSQGKIYQAKTFVDINVVIALASVHLLSGSWTGYWIDTFGTLIIALYLLVRSYLMLKAAKAEPEAV